MPEPTLVIGWLTRPHGLAGALRARATGPTLCTVSVGERLTGRGPDGRDRRLIVTARAGDEDRPILSFDGVDSRDAAAELAGSELRVPPDRAPALEDPDTFYVRELLGFRVLAGSRELGVVAEIHPGPANDAIEVRGEEGEVLVLVPFTADAVISIDAEGRRLIVREQLLP